MADSSADARLEEDVTVSWNPFTDHAQGRPSKIYDYCIDPQREGKTCIWLCRRQGHSFVAWDVAGEDMEHGDTCSFRMLAGEKWWHRFTFYNYVAARHVQIKFLREQKEGQGFLVVARNVNHDEEISRMQQVVNSIELQDPLDCGVDAKGGRHAVTERDCGNQTEDEIGGGTYCAALHCASEAQRIRKWTWMPEMLNYFWRHGLEQDGFEFLDGSGFLLRYEHLAYENYTDAEDPYGKAVNALELVRGWRMRRVLWTTLAAIAVDVCIVAIITLLSRSGETGLAAGSYAAAIQALLMALITLLGAVSK